MGPPSRNRCPAGLLDMEPREMGAEWRIFGRCGGGGSGECVLGQAKTVALGSLLFQGKENPV